MVAFVKKDRYTIEDLLTIMAILRSPNGCPWDRAQTHRSVRANFIEETYEAVEAIDTGNVPLLQEELGDVLMQVVLHARMEEEAGHFSFDDVVDGVAKKLVLRHPHVFGDITADTQEQVLQNWDAIKMASKHQETMTQVLRSVSPSLPALMRSDKLQKKAAKAAGVAAGKETALVRAEEALHRVKQADGDKAQLSAVGDLLFACAGLARALGQEPEEALYQANERFIERFEKTEQKAAGCQCAPDEVPAREWDGVWQPEA